MCLVCNQSGVNNCPACTVDDEWQECEECGGTGKLYYNVETGDEIPYYELKFYQPDEYDSEECEHCNGEGRI